MIAANPIVTPQPARRALRRAGFAVLCASVLRGALGLAMAHEPSFPEIRPLRVGFSAQMFSDVNENDAKAAMKVWGQVVGAERGVPVESFHILRGVAMIVATLQQEALDAVAMGADEYVRVRDQVPLGPFVFGVRGGEVTDEYLLLVRRDSGIDSVADLPGRRLNVYQNVRMCLAEPWIDMLLLQAGCARAEDSCRIARMTKLPRAVLPVYFGQTDACLVNRTGYRLMCELNPQVGEQLKPLAVSPRVAAAVFCFRRNADPALRDAVLGAIEAMGTTAAGRQTLVLFQSDQLRVQPESVLNSAVQLLDQHRRIAAQRLDLTSLAGGGVNRGEPVPR